MRLTLLPLVLLLPLAHTARPPSPAPALVGPPWARHTIDDSSRGADGVRFADVNGDRLPDLVTGWEEGGVVRAYVNPGRAAARSRWPAVDVASVASPEDAVFIDLDGDRSTDVVTSTEGRTRTMFVSWAPRGMRRFLDPNAWRTDPIPPTRGVQQWMFAVPLDVDGRHGIDLIAGGKGPGAQVGWLESPRDARDLDAWTWHRLHDAGWVMSLIAFDMDADGDRDIAFTDRYGRTTGAYWLENPGAKPARESRWPLHPIGGAGREVMFMTIADLDADGGRDVITSAKPGDLLIFRGADTAGRRWNADVVPFPAGAGRAKGVAAGDIDLDGRPDVIVSCEQADEARSGVLWLSLAAAGEPAAAHDISGPAGTKFDLVELVDLDGDGDLDVVTCEETENLGVIWYENPVRP